MEFETLLVTVEDGIGIMQINRPKALNAVNAKLLEEAIVALTELENNPEVKAIIVTGGEKVFAAGADIKGFMNYTPIQARDFIDKVHLVMNKLEDNHKPVVAAICGFALGGGTELTLACDVRVAAENATFGLPEVNLGILPGGGGTQRLSRIVGIGRAKELILTGDFIDGKRAYEIGLVNYVVPADQVMETAKKVAKKLAKKPPLAIRLAKSCINQSMNADIKTGLRLEQEAFSLLFGTEDQKECMAAFAENRKANIKGR